MASIILGSGVVMWLVCMREPSSMGHSLSYWLRQLDGRQPDLAQAAIHSMGARAVPFLLREVNRGCSARERIYAFVWPNLTLAVQKRLSPPQAFRKYGNPNSRVVGYLNLLDPSAAVPGLVEALQSGDSQVQITALAAISGFGKDADRALPSLMDLTWHPNGYVRRWAICAIDGIGSNRVRAIPALLSRLKDPDDSPLPGSPARVRETAARVLGDIGFAADAAVPELKNLLAESDHGVRREAAIALWKIRHDPDAVQILIGELDNRDSEGARKAILEVLGEMGPLARSAVPAIRNIIDPFQRPGSHWVAVTNSPAPAPKAGAGPAVTKRMTKDAPTLVETAREVLRKVDPRATIEVSDHLFDDPPGLLDPK